MARYARIQSPTGYYHIMMRGVNRQDIFYDDDDRRRFIDTIRRYQENLEVQIIAYCLMSNHVHIILRVDEGLPVFVKKLSSSYVYWFNHKYERIGHLFQDRYKSEVIDSALYLMTVVRYILHNPPKAGICSVSDYKWSSYAELINNDFCDVKILYEIAGGKRPLLDFILSENDDQCMDIGESKNLSENDVIAMMMKLSGLDSPLEVSKLNKNERDKLFAELKKKGASVRQLSRITGISRKII